ncbi:MAG: helix-turn-helix domain-containing protein [Methylocystaceae bacterium]|nr:helix-turn-helix domain-containing protein [Methylocystaceae bacterium]
MMTSHPEKRPFCVVPVRAVASKKLLESDKAVLMALGYYANRAGVCWPSIRSLADVSGVETQTVQNAIKRLVKAKMIRQLNPNDYNQKEGVWGHSNRYQIMWTEDAPVPKWEEVRDANLLQPKQDRDQIITEGLGVRGACNEQLSIHIRQLAGSWAAATERIAGFRPAQPPPMAALAGLAVSNTHPSELAKATEDLTSHRIKIGLGIPSFQMVIDHLKNISSSQNTAACIGLLSTSDRT